MLIKEIMPIENAGVNLLSDDNALIDKIVELPLRSACKIFRSKGIQTVMSSANKNNLVNLGDKRKEKEDVYGTIESLLRNYTFLEAGRGYAWIMINFDSLSDDNKDLTFRLEEEFGDNAVWFVHPAEMHGSIEFCLKIGKYSYDFLKETLADADIPKGIKVDERLIEFEKRHICLMYPWTESSTEAVFLRMPLNIDPTVDEVREYFNKIAGYFKDQTLNETRENLVGTTYTK